MQTATAYKSEPFTQSISMHVTQVQNLIERCLQLYMTRKDVVSSLQLQAKIEPGFTSLGGYWVRVETQC